jgi:glycosyltransferase involved in cell wall biosynthesis
MNIKKIFIAHSWPDLGLNIQTKAVAKSLSEKIPVVFISQARIGESEIKISDTLSVIEWPHKRPNKIADFLFILKKIIKEKPDAIIVHFGATNICMIAAKLLRVKYRICWMHTLTEQFYLDSKGDNKAAAKAAATAIKNRQRSYRFATHIVVQNEYARKDAISGYKIPDSKIVKIFNGIIPIAGKADSEVKPDQIKSIRYLGRLDESKGVDILLQSFGMLLKKRNDVCLEIAGKGSSEDSLRQWVKDHGVEKNIIFNGYISDYKEIENFISKAYCIIVPSRMDNFPTVILESFASGVPVIASAVGGITDMIEDEKTGLLIEAENVKQLATAMLRLVSDISFRNKISHQAKEHFDNNFTVQSHVKNVTQFLNGLN